VTDAVCAVLAGAAAAGLVAVAPDVRLPARRRISGGTPVQWAQALLFLSGALRAGASLDDALRLLSERAPDALRRRIAASGWDAALSARARVERMLAGRDTAFARAALVMFLDSGGRIGRGLETAATTLQSQGEAEQRVRALTAQARASAWIVGLSPFALAAAMWLLAPDLAAPLVTTGPGRLMLVASLTLSGGGLWLALRLSRVDA
jgi:tight adherence protein B